MRVNYFFCNVLSFVSLFARYFSLYFQACWLNYKIKIFTPKESTKEKKENTQMFLTSSQEYSLQLSRFLQAGKPALFASLVASLDARHCFCRAKLAEHCLRAMPEFARLKRFGVAEHRNTAERVYTREDVENTAWVFLSFSYIFFLFVAE